MTVMTTWTSLRRPLTKLGRKRPVGEPTGQDRVFARAAFATEERAGDATRGVHALLDVDGQGEEVELVFRLLAGGGCRQQHAVAEVGDGGTGGLASQLAGLEADRAGTELAVVDNGFSGGDLVVSHEPSKGLSWNPPSPAFFAGLRSKFPGRPVAATFAVRLTPGNHYRGPAEAALVRAPIG